MYRLLNYLLHILIVAAAALSFFGLLPYTWWHILGTAGILITACYVTNLIVAKIFNVQPNFESQFITAEILTLIIGPFNPLVNWPFLLLVSVIAMSSKYVLTVKKRHIFNPAAVGLVACALILNQSASWWIGNIYLLPIVLIGGLLLIYKLRWFHLIWSFIISYAVLLVVTGVVDQADLQQILFVLKATFLNTGILFFSLIMLTEPSTAPSRMRNRIIYGILVAVVLIGTQRYLPSIYYNLEFSLVVGNLIAFALSPNFKQKLKLKDKIYFARNSLLLNFSTENNIKFIPGQYMQFLLPHKNPDNRGTRRYFSIASSPTEKTLMLATKFPDEPSTYKQELQNLNKDQIVLASSLDGDFVLPKNEKLPLVFMAGGIGITPFRSMIKYLLDNNQKRDIVLFYSNRDYDEIGFTDLFDEAEEKIGLKTVYILTAKTPGNWSGKKGFLTPKIIRDEVSDYENRTFYLSGPDAMVRAYQKMLREMGLNRSQIKSDYFPGYE